MEKAVLGVHHSPLKFSMPAGACDAHVHVFGPGAKYPLAPDHAYTPGAACVQGLLAMHRQLGIVRRVIVHPSVYGSDMRCSLDAAAPLPESTRLVAVIDGATADEALVRMHETGVRGVRINLHTHGVFDAREAARQLLWTQERVRGFGWHLQLFASVGVVVRLAAELDRLDLPLVLDHWGKVDAARGPGDPEFAALMRLLETRPIWVKLSAPERISQHPDFDDVPPLLAELVRRAPDRLVWGSDWPHTALLRAGRSREAIEPFRPVDDGAALNRLSDWLGDASLLAAVLAENPARLYGFEPDTSQCLPQIRL
jgi:predicted TIM-barrel fold metal-dependent hydrolase